MTMKRAHSLFEIKAASASGLITGIASTPSPDRGDDIVIPQGAVFKLPLPLLWQHDASQPIGHVTEAKVTAAGIEIVAQIAMGVSDYIDKAWALIKAGLVRGLSIGFMGIDVESIPNSWGVIFKQWEWLELSAVTIPMNAEASITSIKKFDADTLAAIGRAGGRGAKPGDAGKTRTVKLTPAHTPQSPKEGTMKTISQKLAEFLEAKKSKTLRMTQIMDTAGDETLGASEGEEYDTLSSEVKTIDAQIVRLKDLEAITSGTATPVGEVRSTEEGSAARSGVQVVAQPKLDPGIAFARLAKAKIVGQKSQVPPHIIAARMYGSDSQTTHVLKAAVAEGTTNPSNWAGDLVGTETSIYADFAAFLRPYTILGRFGLNGVPALRSVPFRTPLILGTGGGGGSWVGEGKPAPVTAFDFDRSHLDPLKVSTICVLSMENLRDSSPSSDAIVRDELRNALAQRLDIDFINPAKAASSGVSPASITNGVSASHSAGTDADGVRADLDTLFTDFDTANNALNSGVILMSMATARTLSLMRNSLGGREFPDINRNGGFIESYPVIASQNVPKITAGGYMVMVNAEDIFLGDEGGFEIDASMEASIEMLDSSLVQDAGAGTGASLVSMFQTNGVAIRATRAINWKKRRASAVAVIDQVAYALD